MPVAPYMFHIASPAIGASFVMYEPLTKKFWFPDEEIRAVMLDGLVPLGAFNNQV